MAGVDYQARLVSEARRYSACMDVHALPEIFHYWSNRYLRPKFQEFGFSSPNDLFQQTVDQAFDGPGPRRFLSLGAGNCDVEIRLASNLAARGVTGFVIDCVDVNAQMLERGRFAAAAHQVSGQLNLMRADLNSWIPEERYDVVLSNQALHHIVNLEGLFSHIERSLAAGGKFVIIDTIGRNGHLRWPEALGLVREFWRRLPPSYRYNLLLDRYEEMFEDWDCSQDGFEGVRSQDILPLLVERFPFQLFVGYGNLLDPFVDRSFGHHFNAEAEWDRDFIDQVHRRNEQGLATGELKPTQMAAIVGKQGSGTVSPARYVRDPDVAVQCPPAVEPVQSPYEWQRTWPDHYELLGARIKACDLRIRDHQRREAEAAAAIEALAKESADRAGWAMRLSRELEERTAWAHSLERELEQRTALCSALESQSGERTAWALRLDRELEQSSALVVRLRADLDARTRWARELEQTLAERTAGAAQLKAEIESSRSAGRSGWMRRALRKLRS